MADKKDYIKTDESGITKPDFKKIPLCLNDLEQISGGKNNYDYEKGQWDTNMDHMNAWYYGVKDRCRNMACNCGTPWTRNFAQYSSDQWWYCFWYNRLYCFGCNEWTYELS